MPARVWKDSGPAGQHVCGKAIKQVTDVHGTGHIAAATVISFADLDGDGRPDYLLTDPRGRTRAWRLVPHTNSSGFYFGWQPLGELVPTAGGEARQRRWAYLNGDRRADQIRITEQGGAYAWINNGLQLMPRPRLIQHDLGRITDDKNVPPADIQFVDVGGNGRADFVRIGWTGVMHIWLNRVKGKDFP